MQKIKIVAVDDHYLTRQGMTLCFTQQPDMEVVAFGEVGDDIVPLVEQHQPDVILLDYKLPTTKNDDTKNFKLIPLLKKLRRDYPALHIIVVSAFHDGILIKKCLEAGANGFFSKQDTQHGFEDAIRVIVQKGQYLSEHAARNYALVPQSVLTRRQLEVLTLINQYPDIKDYAVLGDMIDISKSTFKKHLTQAMRRLGTPGNRLAAVNRAKEAGLLE